MNRSCGKRLHSFARGAADGEDARKSVTQSVSVSASLVAIAGVAGELGVVRSMRVVVAILGGFGCLVRIFRKLSTILQSISTRLYSSSAGYTTTLSKSAPL